MRRKDETVPLGANRDLSGNEPGMLDLGILLPANPGDLPLPLQAVEPLAERVFVAFADSHRAAKLRERHDAAPFFAEPFEDLGLGGQHPRQFTLRARP
jgi:hypothetical protein